jgi:hypothetical protein
MSPDDKGFSLLAAAGAGAKSRVRSHRRTLTLVFALAALAAFPALADAHGAVNPIATSYLAKVAQAPAGLEAKVVDGDVRLWLRVQPTATTEILDYRGGPYLRFSRSGVEVNVNSAMYYLNQNPAETPPGRVSPTVPSHWQQVTSGHDYEWHDGRLQALASVALSPGVTNAGTWRIPVLVAGHASAISGSLLYAADPSIVWFWPIGVLFACVLAAWRLRRAELDARLARVLAVAALVPVAVSGAGRELHGRPTVSIYQFVILAVILAFVAWGLRSALFGPLSWFGYFLISLAALWTGLVQLPTLWRGYVLMSLPAFVARTATVLCLGAGAGLLLLVGRIADQRGASDEQSAADLTDEWDLDDDSWEESWA